MTVNDIIGKIAERIKACGTLSMDSLRLEHPDSANCEVPSVNYARNATKGMTREDIIADIVVDEFSLEFDVEIDG